MAEPDRDPQHRPGRRPRARRPPTRRTSASRGAGRRRRRARARGRPGRACPAPDASGSGCRAACPGASASGCPGRTPWGRRAGARRRRGMSPRRSRVRRRGRSVRAGRGRRVGCQGVALREEVRERPSKDRLAMPRTATMPPAARGHQTLSTYISARFDEFSRSQKDVAQYVVDHLDEVAFHTAEELARRANTSSLDRRALQPGARLRGLPGAAGGGARGVPPPPPDARRRRRPATPLFSLDQSPFEQAVAADHVNVEDTARRVSPLRGRGRDRGDRRRRADPDRRHRPDGVLRLLPAPPADAARRARRDRRVAVAGSAVAAGTDRRAHAGDRAVRRASAPAGGARDEDRPPPPRRHAGDRGRDALGRLQAGRADALLLVATRRRSCARTRGCCRSCRRSRTACTRATPRSTTIGSARFD